MWKGYEQVIFPVVDSFSNTLEKFASKMKAIHFDLAYTIC